MKIGKDAISEQRDILRTKPRKVKPPQDSSTIDTKDKEIDPYGRTSFITEDEEQRERRIKSLMEKSNRDHHIVVEGRKKKQERHGIEPSETVLIQ
jgi:hypothetical protein